jgi:short-subunit dehydrogenase
MSWSAALVTGGSLGIGAALARRLAARGTRVAICARRREPLDEVAASLGENAVAIQADLSDPARAAAVVDEAAERMGGLDLVVANAGIGIRRSGRKLTPADVLPTLQLNLVGACATLTAAIPHFIKRGSGHLVGISSVAGYRGLPGLAAYSASKAGLSTFLESLRVDLRPWGIRVTDVRPAYVDTPLTQTNRRPMPFLMGADEAARRILRALERGRAVYTFPWPMALFVRFLSTLPPAVYDRVMTLARRTRPAG